jgi:lactoylglutathione lyase
MICRSSLIVAVSFVLGTTMPARAEPPAKAGALDHVAIQVVDLDRSVAFYKAVFGLPEVPAPFPGARWLALGGGIMLHIVGNRTAPSEHSRWDHIAIAGGDMDATIANLAARHIAWIDMDGAHTPQVRPDGVKQIFIQDPDGYWIEINDALKTPR